MRFKNKQMFFMLNQKHQRSH